ncbi:MAG: hypothetical protein PHH51_01870 [Bacilli bacterium]|nr:hypothetical protein [Bacilli bacterium]MDD3895427.1 hypothetical protein [Bacilli bacterium]MDD4407614.1 hypothetical protein [Bacilli bacterium]
MNVYGEFFLKFMEPFFGGIISLFTELGKSLFRIFNILTYIDIIKEYITELSGIGIVMVVIATLCLLLLFGLFFFFVYKLISNFVKYRQRMKHQESLVEEIDNLNNEVIKLKSENEKFLNMTDPNSGEIEYDEEGNVINKLSEGESRFFKLTQVDNMMETYEAKIYAEITSLESLCQDFLNYSASKLGLYYDISLIRLFVAAFASNRLIILQGISGTGKTSLAYAWGNFVNNNTVIAPVQPSWRDSSELFGYFNEFTKRFNETEVLTKMYEAKYLDNVYTILLDEMNISRVEYYFAEMLSILELPSADEWVIDLVPNTWANDPKLLENGRLKIPFNMWYVGTINNDDSTFMITDKVYDRAMPINIDTKIPPFEAPDTEAINLSSKNFIDLFNKSKDEHPVSEETLNKVAEMDDYVITHFRIAFGNRIVKQLRDFIPAYVACGGDEMVAVDYIIAHKILRKFDQLNLSYIRNEIDGFITFLNQTFGQDVMKECIIYLERLKKTI